VPPAVSELPEEVSVDQAAKILGVNRKQVVRYMEAGLTEWRDLSLPGSARSKYRLTLRSVMKLRTSYTSSSPTAKVSPERRTRGKSIPLNKPTKPWHVVVHV
jgi:hypothetical protein